MKSWQFITIIAALVILLGPSIFQFLIPSVEYSVAAPKVIEQGQEGSLIVRTAARGGVAVRVQVDLLGASTEKSTYLMKSDSLEIPFTAHVDSPAVLYRLTVRSAKNDYNFIGRVDIRGGAKVSGLYLLTDKVRYRPGDTVRILAMDYSFKRGLKPNTECSIKLSDARGNIIEEKALSSEDGLILYEIELSDKVNQGEWVLSAKTSGKTFHTKFTVENFVRRIVDLEIHCENDILSTEEKTSVKITARHFAGGNLDGQKVTLEASSYEEEFWNSESMLENGEAVFSIEPQKLMGLSHVTFSVALTGKSSMEKVSRSFPVQKLADQIIAYPVKGFVLEGEPAEVMIKIPGTFIRNGKLREAVEISYAGKTLDFKVTDKGTLRTEIPGTGRFLVFSELFKNKKVIDTQKWVTRGLDLQVNSVSSGSILGQFSFSRKLYKADTLKLSLKLGAQELSSFSGDLNAGNVISFKLLNKGEGEDTYIEYELLKGKKVLAQGRERVVPKKIASGINLSFPAKETKPGEIAALTGALLKPKKGVAALIVQDESLASSGVEEGFRLLKSQLLPALSTEMKIDAENSISHFSSNKGQVLHYNHFKNKKLKTSFAALFWSAMISFVLALVLWERRRIFLKLLILFGGLAIIAAMLLPALGKARHKAKDAKIHSEMIKSAELHESAKTGQEVRRDFRGNLLFSKVQFDDKGKFTLPVKFADNLTTWKAEVLGFPENSSVKYGQASIIATKDLFAELSLPVFFVKGDKTSLRVLVFDKLKKGARLTLTAPETVALEQKVYGLPEGRERHELTVPVEFLDHGTFKLLLSVENDTNKDIQEQAVKVKSGGISRNESTSVSLYALEDSEFKVDAIEDAITQTNFLSIYPGSLSENLSGVESMFREPNGCFEQTSSSNFPNIVAYKYLKDRKIDPKLEEEVLRKLKKAYQKLASYEVKSGGFSLYGQAPANPWLTSYGILQFSLMSKHIYVDPKIIERSWAYLKPNMGGLAQREKLFSLYCAQEAGLPIERTLDGMSNELHTAMRGKNLWEATLATLLLKNNKDKNVDLLKRKVIKDVLNEKGYFDAVNSSSGEAPKIVVTALALQSAYENKLQNGAQLKRKLLSLKRSGRWHGTMATAMALRALSLTEDRGDKRISVKVNSEEKVYDLKSGNRRAFQIPLNDGDLVSLNLLQGEFLSCHLSRNAELRYENKFIDESSFTALIKVRDKTIVGDGLTVSLVYKSGKSDRANLMAELPLPAGFKIDENGFRQMISNGKFRYYEIAEGNVLVLYLNDLKNESSNTLEFQIFSTVKGRFKSAAGKVYEYYKPEVFVPLKLPEIVVE